MSIDATVAPPVAAGRDAGDPSAVSSRRTERPSRRDLARRLVQRGSRARLLGDGVAAALLVAVLVWLADHDGGTTRPALLWTGVLAVLALPAAIDEARRLPGVGRAILTWWGLGLLVASVFALERSAWVPATMVLALTPVVFLSALRLWRRPWGPPLVGAVLLLALGRYWQRSFLQWWGHTLDGRAPMWLALSWHNQSAALMGAFGVLSAGAAVTSRRALAAGFGLAASGGLAGAWLSGSRAGILLAAGALAVTVLAAVRSVPHGGRRSVLVRSLLTLGVAGGIVVALTGMVDAGMADAQPVANRDEAAATTLGLRLRHMEAAVGMALEQPLTGHGFGSYATQAAAHTAPDANLTSSAHNEYVEMLAEGGVVFGGAFLAAALLAGALVAAALRRPAPTGPGVSLRASLAVGAVGAATLLLTHAALDFDWDYPVLPALLAVAVAMLVPDRRDGATSPVARRRATVLAAPLAVTLIGTTTLGWYGLSTRDAREDLSAREYATATAPWAHVRARQHAATLMARGDLVAADLALERTQRWNPGVDAVRVMRDLVAFERGRMPPEDLAASIDPRRTPFDLHTRLASALVDAGRPRLAIEVLDAELALLESRWRWGIARTEMNALVLRVEATAEADGCAAARGYAAGARSRRAVGAFSNGEEALAEAADRACERP